MAQYKVGVARRTIEFEDQWFSDEKIFLWGMASAEGRDLPVKQADLKTRLDAGDVLQITAITVTDEANHTIALATLDVGNLTAETTQWVRSEVTRRTGIPGDHICLNVSHTHAAPTMVELGPYWPSSIGVCYAPFRERVEGLTADAIVAAFDARTEADLYFGRGTTKTGYDRRALPPNIDSQDEILDVLHAVTSKGPLATVFRASIHPVWVVAPTISADFPGVARQAIEPTYGTALFVQGWAGNCDPRGHKTYSNVKDLMPKMVEHGQQLAADVRAVLAPTGGVALSGMTQLQGGVAARSITILHPLQSNNTSVPQEVQALIIGSPRSDWHFVGCAHEVTTDQAPKALAALPFDHVTLAGYCNQQRCYIPSDHFIEVAGYEGLLSQEFYGNVTESGAADPFPYGTADRLIEGIIKVTDPGWTQIGPAERIVALAAAGEYLYAATHDDKLLRRKAKAVNIEWEPMGHAEHVVGLAAIGATLYCATREGQLWSRAAEGSFNLPWLLQGPAEQIVAMTAFGQRLYAATGSSTLWQREVTQVNLPWTPIGSAEQVVGLATARDRLICATAGSLWWRDVEGGEQPWKRIGTADLIALCSLGGQLYGASANGVLWTRSF